MDKKLLLLATVVLAVMVLLAGMWDAQTSLAQSGAYSQRATAVGVCDVVEVFNNYQRAKDLTADFKVKRDSIQQQHDARSDAIEEKDKELQSLLEGSPEYEKQYRELRMMVNDAQVWAQTEESLAQREHLRLTTEMYDEILGMISVVSNEQGFDIILFRETRDTKADTMQDLLLQMQNRKVLYNNDDVDITDRVLNRLNMAYEANRR